MPRQSHPRLVIVLAAVALGSLASPRTTHAADRDFILRLLPRSTIAYCHVPDLPALLSAASQTSLGRLLREPEIERSVSHMLARNSIRDGESPPPPGDFRSLVRLAVGTPVRQLALALVAEPDGSAAPVLICEADRLDLT